MPAIPADAHVVEIGQPGGPGSVGSGGAYGSWLTNQWEETPELAWPLNTIVFDRMRRSDSQVGAVLRAITLPVMAASWHLGTDDVDPKVVEFVRTELGLHLDRQASARRRRQGIVWRDYLRHALLSLSFGHMPFEQVYAVDAPGPDQVDIGLPHAQVAHLRKLAPRMPRSLTGIDVAPDGGLAGIRQLVHRRTGTATAIESVLFGGSAAMGLTQEVPIPVANLVFHANDREGGDWTGSSILRASYKNWLIKDRLLRLGAMIVERNGMGLPVVTFDDAAGGSRDVALELSRSARAGEDAGAALPAGYTLQLIGVTGSTKDELPLVNYHDQQVGKNTLAMFLDLGHDNGARALGDTFVDFFGAALNAVAGEFAEVATEHVVRDLVELNFGQDEPYPPVTFDPIQGDQVLQPADLAQLVTAGVILPDDDLDAEIRRRYRLPAPMEVDEPDVPIDPTIAPPPFMPPAYPPPALPPGPVATVPIPLPGGRPARRSNAAQLAQRTAALNARAQADAAARQAADRRLAELTPAPA